MRFHYALQDSLIWFGRMLVRMHGGRIENKFAIQLFDLRSQLLFWSLRKTFQKVTGEVLA